MVGEETARELRQVGAPLLIMTLVSRGTHLFFRSYMIWCARKQFTSVVVSAAAALLLVSNFFFKNKTESFVYAILYCTEYIYMHTCT